MQLHTSLGTLVQTRAMSMSFRSRLEIFEFALRRAFAMAASWPVMLKDSPAMKETNPMCAKCMGSGGICITGSKPGMSRSLQCPVESLVLFQTCKGTIIVFHTFHPKVFDRSGVWVCFCRISMLLDVALCPRLLVHGVGRPNPLG